MGDGTADLLRQIEESGMLDDDHLDLLAEAFLAAGEAVSWEIPDDWFSEEGIVIGFVERDEADDEDEDEEGEEEVDPPTMARREVFPPLRRWAAGRVVGGHPDRWGQVFARAGDLDSRSTPAVMAGLLDVLGVLKPASQEFLVEQATRWPNHSVRRMGLALVAERKGADAAYALAQADPDAGIRRWAERAQETGPPTLF